MNFKESVFGSTKCSVNPSQKIPKLSDFDLDISSLDASNYQETVGKYLLQSGVLDDEWNDWEEAVWTELTA